MRILHNATHIAIGQPKVTDERCLHRASWFLDTGATRPNRAGHPARHGGRPGSRTAA
jgi:hypothetical protein